ncbi:MAG: ribonuclease HI [Gemmatimonadetes bacterium]|nr:ribonuclease HI [Gemmatimonadota bacterium]MBI3567509.1 ribonuclease HI [Gemmatimonadota bacterium]
MSDRALVAIYADESCLGNGQDGDNPGGAGALVEYRVPATGALVRRDLWISERATTNNRMALRSVSDTLRALGAKGARFDVVFTTDSRYIVDGMTQWVFGWARNGWKRKGGAIENLERWYEAIEAASEHAVAWRWVKGHDGHAQNEYANHLATRAAADQTHSDGLVPSAFETWLAATRAKGAKHGDPFPFPEAATFRAARALPAVP